MERGARRPGFLVNPERMTTRLLSIGFAGVGVMGRPMASHLALDVPPPLSALDHELRRAAAADASVSERARWVERLIRTEIAPGVPQ